MRKSGLAKASEPLFSYAVERKKCPQVSLLPKNMSRLPRAPLLQRWNAKASHKGNGFHR